MPEPRPLTERERAALDALLGVDFPGVDALRAQAASALADPERCPCGCGTVELVTTAPPASVPLPPVAPAELQVLDDAGEMTGHVTLRLRTGTLLSLAVGWYDAPLPIPDLAATRLFVPEDCCPPVVASVVSPARESGDGGRRTRQRPAR